MGGDGVLPLSEAVTMANANGEADEIGCATGLEGTLRLANGRLENGRLAIGDAVRISGDTDGGGATVLAACAGRLSDPRRTCRRETAGRSLAPAGRDGASQPGCSAAPPASENAPARPLRTSAKSRAIAPRSSAASSSVLARSAAPSPNSS